MGKVDQKVKTSSYKIKKIWRDVMYSIWRRKWQSTPIFLPEEFHGWRSLAGYSVWGRRESEMTELLTHTMHSMVTVVNNVCVCVCACACVCVCACARALSCV